MDHNQHEIGELTGNLYFREWVFFPDEQSDQYWEAYKAENPDKLETIKAAREILLMVQENAEMDFPDEERINRMFRHIQMHKSPKRLEINRYYGWAAAACIVMLATAFWYQKESVADQHDYSYQILVEESEEELREFVNCTETPTTVMLTDGSEVRLEPGSRISYPSDFGKNSLREVYLDGTAFFEVTKDPDKPFVVYANELITRVLGTSFWILKSADRSELLVEVVTGKVAVSTQKNMEVKTTEPLSDEGQILVTPNQQLLFSRKTVSIKKNLVPRPLIIKKPGLPEELEFDDVAAEQVFNAIEKAYGVEIEFDASRIGACLVTASLTGESLYETVSAICEAINARYHVADTKIIIEGYGCP